MIRNYIVSPRNTHWLNRSIASNDQMLGSNGQCIMYECHEWINGECCYPELVREDKHGFAICPKCGRSYGVDAMTGEEYRRALEA